MCIATIDMGRNEANSYYERIGSYFFLASLVVVACMYLYRCMRNIVLGLKGGSMQATFFDMT